MNDCSQGLASMAMITDIEIYFVDGCGRCERFQTADCSARRWKAGLADLRQICLHVKLVETIKWGHPCYMHANRNIAILGALRNDFRLSFFNAALLQDREKVLEKQGPNTRHPDMIRFTEPSQVAKRKSLIEAYLLEAMDYAERGVEPLKEKYELEIPEELVEALGADPELSDAFYKLTPGRQKSYLLQLKSAKKSETRLARIAKYRDHILAGKGALER